MQEFAQELGPMLGAFPSASLGSSSPGSTLPLLRDAELVVQECMDRVLLSSQWGRKIAGLEPSFTVIVDSFERRVEEAEAVVDAKIKAFVSSAITSLFLTSRPLLPLHLSSPCPCPVIGRVEEAEAVVDAEIKAFVSSAITISPHSLQQEQVQQNWQQPLQQQQLPQQQQQQQQQQEKDEKGLSETASAALSMSASPSAASTTLPGDTATPTAPDTITSKTTDTRTSKTPSTLTSTPADTVTSAHSSTALDKAASPPASPASETTVTGTRSTVTAAGGKGEKAKGRGSGSKESSKEGHALEGALLAGLLRLMGEDGAADLLYKAMGIGPKSASGVGGTEGSGGVGKSGRGSGKRRMGEDEAAELLGKAMAFLNRDGDNAGSRSGGDVGGKSGSDVGGEIGSVRVKHGDDKSANSVDDNVGNDKSGKTQSTGSNDGGDEGLSGIFGKDKALTGSGTGADSSGGMSPVDSSIDKTGTSSAGFNGSGSSINSTVTVSSSRNAELSRKEGIKGVVEKKQEAANEIAAEEKHLAQRGLDSTDKSIDEDPAQESIRQVVSAIRGKLAAAVAEGTRGMAGLVDSAKEARLLKEKLLQRRELVLQLGLLRQQSLVLQLGLLQLQLVQQ
ncbi:unnamed protein product [Closterium sp. Yama58-4]|nr:unnamed protein product [Closterium sp. Yama58-4]